MSAIIKHMLPARPDLGEWLSSTVPEVGMLVWVDDRTEPLLIGDITRDGGQCDCCNVATVRRHVVAYARLTWEVNL